MFDDLPVCVFQMASLFAAAIILYLFIKRDFNIHRWISGFSGKDWRRVLIIVFFLGTILRLTIWPFLTPSDEGLYIYQSKLLFEGQRPYLDFALHHPPGYHYLTSFIYKIFGVGLLQAKLSPLIFSVLSLPLFYLVAKLMLEEREAIFASFIYSLSYGVAAMSAMALLYSESLFFGLLGIYFFLKSGREKLLFLVLAGVSFSISVFFRLFGIVPLIAVVLVLLKEKRIKHSAFVAMGFIAIFGSFMYLFWSPNFIHGLFLFHTQKPDLDLYSKISIAGGEILGGFPLVVCFGFLGLITPSWKKKYKSDYSFLFIYLVLGILAVLLSKHTNPSVVKTYFAVAAVPLALFSGKSLNFLKERQIQVLLVALLLVGTSKAHVLDFYLRKDWHQNAMDASAFIIQETQRGDYITGGYSATPGLAFLADRKISPKTMEYDLKRGFVDPLTIEDFRGITADSKYLVSVSRKKSFEEKQDTELCENCSNIFDGGFSVRTIEAANLTEAARFGDIVIYRLY
ncbi:MAG: glycosyltransferase family 39 protein [Candidatus Altiarchaeota archaeon]